MRIAASLCLLRLHKEASVSLCLLTPRPVRAGGRRCCLGACRWRWLRSRRSWARSPCHVSSGRCRTCAAGGLAAAAAACTAAAKRRQRWHERRPRARSSASSSREGWCSCCRGRRGVGLPDMYEHSSPFPLPPPVWWPAAATQPDPWRHMLALHQHLPQRLRSLGPDLCVLGLPPRFSVKCMIVRLCSSSI